MQEDPKGALVVLQDGRCAPLLGFQWIPVKRTPRPQEESSGDLAVPDSPSLLSGYCEAMMLKPSHLSVYPSSCLSIYPSIYPANLSRLDRPRCFRWRDIDRTVHSSSFHACTCAMIHICIIYIHIHIYTHIQTYAHIHIYISNAYCICMYMSINVCSHPSGPPDAAEASRAEELEAGAWRLAPPEFLPP